MRLSKLYTNKPDVFSPILFRPGVNVVLAEIRLPENRAKDTHNLGKSTLGRLIDFAFLVRRDSRFFLFKHQERFEDFVFFLEIELIGGGYLTVRRSVRAATKIAFKKHQAPDQDYSRLTNAQWDHFDLPFEKARSLLDSLLDWRGLKPWNYRQVLGYLLRSQDDYRDIFQLGKFASGHADWKPFLAHLLGFDGDMVAEQYSQEAKLAEDKDKADTLRQELGTDGIDDPSKIDGMLLLKTVDLEKKQARLDQFDFRLSDKERNKQITDEIDEQIAALNSRRYTLSVNRKKISKSLDEGQILFSPDDAQSLFMEAGILFDGQIKRDFQQLIEFNKAITEERRAYLLEEQTDIEVELKDINTKLNTLGRKRSEALSFLSDTDAFDKYKLLTNELVTLRAEVAVLEKQRALLHRLHNVRTDIRTKVEQLAQTQAAVEADVEAQNSDVSSRFSTIRLFFNEIIEDVLDRKALLSVAINKAGHLDFHAEILDEAGNSTSADLGHTYKKLLCVAFDLAVLRAHCEEPFPRFAFHDGIFESLDDRKKENLLEVLRKYADLGLQEIITLIDSDMPPREGADEVFDDSEIILTLHDEGDDGRLFQIPAW
jgi:uncharacterized protein YydD (DUF2326 family)